MRGDRSDSPTGDAAGARQLVLLILLPVCVSASCLVDFHDPPIPILCGDGELAGDERCDDGNAADGDGCSATCVVEAGWSCQGVPSTCATSCGDGIQAGTEDCDGTDLGSATCSSLQYAGGELSCATGCVFDLASCAACGDGTCDGHQDETIDSCAADCGFVHLTVGDDHSCAVRADGTVWCWGDNEHGELGDGTLTPFRDTPVQVTELTGALQVDAGGYHACALVADGGGPSGDTTAVWCWGSNQRAQLGISDLGDHPTPVRVQELDGLAVQLDVGWVMSCARLTDGTVRCWGNHQYSAGGQTWSLGHCALTEEYSPTPVEVDGVSGALFVSADASSGGALLPSGEILCWGSNPSGQRGNGTYDVGCPPTTVALSVSVDTFVMGDSYAMALAPNGEAWAWGDNDWGQLGDGTLDQTPSPVQVQSVPPLRDVGLGWDHTCATTETGGALCWGRDDEGQLGRDTTDATFQPPGPVVGLDQGVRQALAGYFHSCALLDSGHVRCWGQNDLGQLGTGTDTGSAVPVDVLFP